ncbi:MAG: long-chain-fatty-acid--CoA ligase [Chloroflexi bacterium]|nr:long-chain-fatty-acid--CoA ligase [Chloroflexota bacterium]
MEETSAAGSSAQEEGFELDAVSRAELSPLLFLERNAYVFADRLAVVDGERRFTYADLRERVHRQATALRQLGVCPGDRVAVLAPNVSALLESHFGVPLSGAALVAINTRLTSREVGYILNHSKARVLIVDVELLATAAPALASAPGLEAVVLVDDGSGRLADGPAALLAGLGTSATALEYEAFLASGEPDFGPASPRDERELIAIDYTSGTTGQPKGVMYTHRGAYLNALSVALEFRLSADSVYLWTLPMFHCNGWCFPWGVTAVGAVHICLRRIDPALVWRTIQQERVTHLCGAPTVLIMLANDPSAAGARLDHPVQIATGGAPPSPTTLAQMHALGVRVTHLYGLTESYGPSTVCEWRAEWDDLPLDEQARIKARQGVANIASCQVRVVDPSASSGQAPRDVPRDGQTVGEIVLRGNTVMRGYLDDEPATRAAFRGGWFHSGDLGVVHPDGYIEVRDRLKDVIISGGENISTIEVEQAVARHPAVLEVAVVAVPDERWGEVPKAFVTLKAGQTTTAEEIIESTRGHLARFKCPKHVEFGELPKTSTGKIQKFVLREREWAGRERRVN